MNSSALQSIFITGAAGGMGQATAARFAAEGWLVGLFDRDERGLAESCASLPAEQVVSGTLDVTSSDDFARAAALFAERSGGRCDVLFNNAGVADGGFFADMPLEQMQRILDINVLGVMRGVKALLPLLKDTPNALCLSTSSSVAIYGHAMRSAYSASKAAVKSLTESLGLEFEAYDIATADILPGCIDTPMLRNAMAARQGGVFDEQLLEGLPASGPYRLRPVSDIADAAWSAYQDRSRRHWYVPSDLEPIESLSEPEARAETRAFLFGR